VHEYKEPSPRGGWNTSRFTCLTEVGQECPGCLAGMKRKPRGVYNVIQRNRPIYRKDSEGRNMKDPAGNYYTDGWADTVVIANVGGPTADMLRQADGQYGGLMSRDFVVGYSGNKYQAWNLAPAMDAQGNSMATPMSDADFQLAAAKHDIDKYMAPPSQQEAAQIVARYGPNSGGSGGQQQMAPQPQGAVANNQFLAGTQIPPGVGVNGFGMVTAGVQPPAPAQAAQPQQPQPVPQQPQVQQQFAPPAQPSAPVQPQPAQGAQQPAPPQPGQPQQPPTVVGFQ
jgi:hypothetical protein